MLCSKNHTLQNILPHVKKLNLNIQKQEGHSKMLIYKMELIFVAIMHHEQEETGQIQPTQMKMVLIMN